MSDLLVDRAAPVPTGLLANPDPVLNLLESLPERPNPRGQYLEADRGNFQPLSRDPMGFGRMTQPQVDRLYELGLNSGFDTGGLAGVVVGRGSRLLSHLRAIDNAEGILARPNNDPVAQATGVFRDTGAYRGPDGLMRYEVPDTRALVNDAELQSAFTGWDNARLSDPTFRPPIYETTLSDILPHPELYEAYPGLGRMSVQIVPGRETITPGGSYAEFTAPLSGPFSSPDDFGQIFAAAPDAETLRRHLLHEVQHAIQTREGFSPGSSPTAPTTTARAASMGEHYAGVADAAEEGLSRAASRLDAFIRRSLPPDASYEQVETATRAFLDSRPDLNNRLTGYEDIIRELRSNNPDIRNRDQYGRAAGEAEARMVPSRADISEDELRQTYPSASYDVNLETLWDSASGQSLPWRGVPQAPDHYISPEMREPNIRFAKGGTMLDTHPPQGLLARQEDGALEELPPGSLPEEVRDDIDVKLSEGEFVIPADAVRWHGMKSLMSLIDEAKAGFGDMAERGLIQRPGGSLVPEEVDEPEDDDEFGEPPEAEKAADLEKYGRNGDSLLAHINEEEAELLMARGGAGTRNPVTGLLEFYDADGDGNAADNSSPTGGSNDSGPSAGGADGGMSTSEVDAAIAGGAGPESPGYGSPTGPVGGGIGADGWGFGVAEDMGITPTTHVDLTGWYGTATPEEESVTDFGKPSLPSRSERAAIGLGRTVAGLAGIPGAIAGPVAHAAVRGLDKPDDVVAALAAVNPVTALGVGVTQALHGLGVPQTGLAETSQQSSASPNSNAGGVSIDPPGIMAPGTEVPLSPNQTFAPSRPNYASLWDYLYADALGLLAPGARRA